MIQSMTGYGKAEYIFSDHKTIVEIRSLNSKQLDLTLKESNLFRDKENDIRSMLTGVLERGKVDVAIYTQDMQSEGGIQPDAVVPINHELFAYYYRELQSIEKELGSSEANLTAAILRIPGVMQAQTQVQALSEEEWTMLKDAIRQALEQFRAFREQEGAALEKMFTEKLDGIAALLCEVEPYEKGRVDKIKQHLLQQLDKLSAETRQAIDQNRLEAELIYYLEKLDITEEKVRLTNHIRYFRETMAQTGEGVGKKLGFIAQEMGREINTLGSKSNQSEMQIIVVKMKDILEQIKEQVLNVL